MTLPDVSHKRVLFVGERIRDVYHFGRLIGRPPKEPIICIEKTGEQVFEGGVTAAADHARGFVKEVQVISTIEMVKERYVDENRYRKLFEVYTECNESLEDWPDLSQFDAVIVTDYGHSMMDEAVVKRLCDQARYLAVNVQTNAGNYGFNLCTKYPRVDYLCVDEIEARLATHNQFGPIEESVEALSHIMSHKVVVTLGRQGAMGYQLTCGTRRSETFSDKVVDTMGAGDAFFAVTACMAQELDIPALLRVGNAAGALKAKSLGQRQVTKDELLNYLNRRSDQKS